jgi:branched-chain amino acid transport system permease protein
VLQFIVVGLVFGSIYALAAFGLVITYVSTGVLNFAFGAFAFFIARFYYFLHVEKEWGILLSAAVSLLVLAPFMGIFFYMAIFRFLRLSSQLIKVVVTIGLSVVIPVLATMIFGNDEIFQAPGLAPQPVSVAADGAQDEPIPPFRRGCWRRGRRPRLLHSRAVRWSPISASAG